MKYNVLEEYKDFLKEKDLRPNTIKTYYNRMDGLLDNQYLITTGNDVDLIRIFSNLSNIDYKNHFSQSKNALTYFLECYQMELTKEQEEMIRELEKSTKKKYRKLKTVEYKKMKAVIGRLKNKKLKRSYQVLMKTGLRVSEVSQIKANDCTIFNGTVQFSFVGKGGAREEAYICKVDSPRLYEDLKYTVENSSSNEKLFYSANYLQKKAKEYGFTCHDLRRAFAKAEYTRTKSKEQVKERLRHSKMKTTNLYLNSKVKMD